ncbi:hypothetical protein ACO1O0_005180 [Amphichorda felina]
MEGSNDGNGRPGGDHGGGDHPKKNMVYMDNIRERIAELERTGQTLRAVAAPYKDEARAQITRALGDEPYGLFYSLMGIDKRKVLAQGTGLIATIAGINGRSLDQPQVEAVADNMRDNAQSTAMLQATLDAGIVMATIPRWKTVPPFLKRRGSLALTWPVILIVAYGIPVQLLLQPVAMGINTTRSADSMRKDPRFQGWRLDIAKELQRISHEGIQPGQTASGGPSREQSPWAQASSSAWGSGSQSQSLDQGSSESWSRQQQAAWESTPQPQRQEQTRSDSWDSADSYDDASPVAPTYRATQGDSSGSAWDRIRHQAEAQSKQPSSRAQWSPPATQTRESWGEEQDKSTRYQGPKESYTYSSADLEKSTPRDQAQREFDQLLDRERHGVDQENKRWK